MTRFNIVTNVSHNDGVRIFYTLPNWVRIFSSRINKILIIVDEKPVEGRIKNLNKNYNPKYELNEVLELLKNKYPLITTEKLDYYKVGDVSSQFFKNAKPIRCQAGTPIFAFLAGIAVADDGILLKTDCDMLYFDNGWVDEAIKLLENNNYDIIEPPKLKPKSLTFSTRSFLINKNNFMKKMPMKAHTVDLIRIIDRKLKRKSIYLALEQMLQKEIEAKRFSIKNLSSELGYTLHIIAPSDIDPNNFDKVIENVENNTIPQLQRNDWDFNWEYWKDIYGN